VTRVADKYGASVQQVNFCWPSVAGQTMAEYRARPVSSAGADDLLRLASRCRYIEVLTLGGVRGVTDRTMQQLFALLPRLKYVDARDTAYGHRQASECPADVTVPANVLIDL
jgi:hypothetical protein